LEILLAVRVDVPLTVEMPALAVLATLAIDVPVPTAPPVTPALELDAITGLLTAVAAPFEKKFPLALPIDAVLPVPITCVMTPVALRLAPAVLPAADDAEPEAGPATLSLAFA
jgi:hypothetical protein